MYEFYVVFMFISLSLAEDIQRCSIATPLATLRAAGAAASPSTHILASATIDFCCWRQAGASPLDVVADQGLRLQLQVKTQKAKVKLWRSMVVFVAVLLCFFLCVYVCACVFVSCSLFLVRFWLLIVPAKAITNDLKDKRVQACIHGDESALAALLESWVGWVQRSGAGISDPSLGTKTPLLHFACAHGQAGIARMLLARGAELNAVDRVSTYPFMHA